MVFRPMPGRNLLPALVAYRPVIFMPSGDFFYLGFFPLHLFVDGIGRREFWFVGNQFRILVLRLHAFFLLNTIHTTHQPGGTPDLRE